MDTFAHLKNGGTGIGEHFGSKAFSVLVFSVIFKAMKE